MKHFKLIMLLAFSLILLSSCDEKGVTEQKIYGNEPTLPDELKGLKIYAVSTGSGNYVKVALLNNQVIGVSYPEGKTTQDVVVINKDRYNERVIEAEEIISETDDIIVIKKKR